MPDISRLGAGWPRSQVERRIIGRRLLFFLGAAMKQPFDLRLVKAGNRGVEIELQIRQEFKLSLEQLQIPSGIDSRKVGTFVIPSFCAASTRA